KRIGLFELEICKNHFSMRVIKTNIEKSMLYSSPFV
ncbi:hypothetical protein EZS27_029696, partial [termite gut metagenome]